MKTTPGTLQKGGAPFRTTHWSVVRLATDAASPEQAEKALAEFCQNYWPPLYTFLRHRGHRPSEAQDLTQGFFAHLLERKTLSRADQEKGRLRTFLLGALQHYLADEYDRSQAQKRGGGQQIIRMDDHLAEAEAAMLRASQTDDTGSYDQAWAANLVRRAWEILRAAIGAEGNAPLLEELKPFLVGGVEAPPSQEQVAARLKVPVSTLRTSLQRLRQRYRETLRAEVAQTISDPAEIDEELHYLYRVLMS